MERKYIFVEELSVIKYPKTGYCECCNQHYTEEKTALKVTYWSEDWHIKGRFFIDPDAKGVKVAHKLLNILMTGQPKGTPFVEAKKIINNRGIVLNKICVEIDEHGSIIGIV